MHEPELPTGDGENVVDTTSSSETTQHFDAIVIGAGLGGLLSAAQLLARGKHVIVLERLPHCGGRFTAKTFQGVQVSTGAVHMVPLVAAASSHRRCVLCVSRIISSMLMFLAHFMCMANPIVRVDCWASINFWGRASFCGLRASAI